MGVVVGGEDDFEAFFVASAPSLRRLAHARTGDWSTAEDLVQEVLADAVRRWDRVGNYDDPVAWARRAVLNRSVSRWRSRGRERRAILRLGGRRAPVVEHEPSFADEALWAELRALPERQQEVVLLLWFEDLSVAEVAATLGCGPETVRTHWRRARARLAEALLLPGDRASDGAGAAPDEPLAERGGER